MDASVQCICGHEFIDHEEHDDGTVPCVAIVLPTMYNPYPEPAEYCSCINFERVAFSALFAEQGFPHSHDRRTDLEMWEIENGMVNH